MDKELIVKLEENKLRCSSCGLLIPFSFKKGSEFTVPSFTVFDEKSICYRCQHTKEFSVIQKKRKKQ